MPFELKKQDNIVVFKLDQDFTKEDFNKILTILDKLLDRKEKFIFLIDGLDIKSAPLESGLTMIQWMKKNKQRIPGVLCGSAIVINYPKLISVINFVFSKVKPTSPNIITSDLEKGLTFLRNL
jgi:hypothetical protein